MQILRGNGDPQTSKAALSRGPNHTIRFKKAEPSKSGSAEHEP